MSDEGLHTIKDSSLSRGARQNTRKGGRVVHRSGDQGYRFREDHGQNEDANLRGDKRDTQGTLSFGEHRLLSVGRRIRLPLYPEGGRRHDNFEDDLPLHRVEGHDTTDKGTGGDRLPHERYGPEVDGPAQEYRDRGGRIHRSRVRPLLFEHGVEGYDTGEE